jgi:hypothetical protein
MKFKNLVGIVCFVLVSLAYSPMSLAADFSVGRVKVKLPGDGWRVVDFKDAGMDYSGELVGTIQSDKKVFIKESATKSFQAMIVVRASAGGISGGTVRYSADCESAKDFVATGMKKSDSNFYDCLRVFKFFTTESLIKELVPDLRIILEKDTAVVPDALQTVWNMYANSNGTFVDVRAFFGTNFASKKAESTEQLPPGIEASTYAWGQELSKGVKNAVNSLFSKLTLPDLEFKSIEPLTQITLLAQ